MRVRRVSCAAVAVVGVVLAGGCSGSEPRAATSAGASAGSSAGVPAAGFEASEADVAAIRALLGDRADAVAAGDRAAFMRDVDRSDPDFVSAQEAFFDNLVELDVHRMRYRVGTDSYPPADVPGGDPVLRPAVVEHVLVPGDRRPVANDVGYTFVRRGDRWLVGAEVFAKDPDAFDKAQSRPWAEGPVAVARRGHLTVVVDRSRAAELPRLADAVRRSLETVADVLDQPYADRLLVDATSSGAVDMLNQAGGGDEAAASTFPVLATTGTTYRAGGVAGWRIKVNPEKVDELVEDDQVMRHELTHYVLRAKDGPLWLTEGIAEYVAWAPMTTLAGLRVPPAFYAQLRRDASRTELVSSATFSTFPQVSYLVAQATVTELVQRTGVAGVLRLMDRYRGHTGPDQGDSYTPKALRTVMGLTEAQLAAAAYDELMSLHH